MGIATLNNWQTLSFSVPSIQLVSPASGEFSGMGFRASFAFDVSIQLVSPASGDWS
jgi:hypothetical protein